MTLTKNQWYIVGVVALIAIWYFFIRKKPTTTTTTTVPTDSVNNYTGDEDDEEDGFTTGRQITQPIISFVIGMKKYANNIEMENETRRRFRRQMIENGGYYFGQPIASLVIGIRNALRTPPPTPTPLPTPSPNSIINNIIRRFKSQMVENGGNQFAQPIVSFVIEINNNKGTNYNNAVDTFRKQMQRI
jgi:hypothetical protein